MNICTAAVGGRATDDEGHKPISECQAKIVLVLVDTDDSVWCTPLLMSRIMKVNAQDKFQCRRPTLGVDIR